MKLRSGAVLTFCLLGAAAQAAATPPLADRVPPPRFRPAPGWVVVENGPKEPNVSPSQVWAITSPDVAALVPIKLFTSLTRLSPRGIAIWAQTIGRGGATRVFTPATLPLRLSTFRVDRGWEGQPSGNVQQRLRWAAVRNWQLDVRVYFATEHPDKRLVRAAQAELDRMLLATSH